MSLTAVHSAALRSLATGGVSGIQIVTAESVTSTTVFRADLERRRSVLLTAVELDGEEAIWQPMVVVEQDWYLPDGDQVVQAADSPSSGEDDDREWIHVEGSTFASGPISAVLWVLCAVESSAREAANAA
ncbi:MAG TPA: hypothetical protein VEX66_04485, partial [Microlunatus sp.]|nr:hypothetical protein [Microlunatus sp.]